MAHYLEDGYHGDTVAHAPEDARIGFIRRTYLHLAFSVAALVGVEAVLLKLVDTAAGKDAMRAWFSSPVSLLVVLGLFIAGGFLARYMARAQFPPVVKYLGLALYIGIEALFLLPIIYVSTVKYGMSIVNEAAILTLVVFAGLSLTVFITKKDFSFLGYGLMVASWLVFGFIVAAIVLGFSLGLFISFVCIALAAGYILYDTSNIMKHYHTDEHVGASLELLADVVLLFYHILRVLYLTRE